MSAASPAAIIRRAAGGSVALELSADGLEYVPSAELVDFSGRHLWVRVRMMADDSAPQPAVTLRGISIGGQSRAPDERAVRLEPSGSQDRLQKRYLRYVDDFTSQRFRLLGIVDNEERLETIPGEIRTRGVKGYANRVTVRHQFVCDHRMAKIRVRMESQAWERDLGAHNELGLSLDGENVLLAETTSGKAGDNGRYSGWLEIDATEDERFEGITSFWVHKTMVNGSGADTNPSNMIREYEVTAETVETAP